MTTADALHPVPSAGAVNFLGEEAVYWRLRVKGEALLMVPLRRYRFWFATDVRRFLWSNTEIGGETLEYTGLATELLGGFLLAIAIMVPLYTAIAGTALALAFDKAEEVTAAISFAVLVLLGQFALYRARRYRLTRTVFRGVRFDQHGAAWPYALYAMLWWSVTVATLGIAYPWAQASLQRFKMRHTCYGDLLGAFEGSGSALFLRGLPIWLLVVGPIVFAFFALGTMVDWDALSRAPADGASGPLDLLAGNIGFHRVFYIGAAALCTSIIAAVLLYPLFQAVIWRWWISGLRFGDVSVSSRLSTAQVYRIYLRFILYIVPYMLLVMIVGGVCVFAGSALIGSALLGSKHGPALVQFVSSAVTLGLYVVIALGASTIYQVVVTFAMWRLGVQSAEL